MSDYRDLDWEMFTGHMFSKKELDEIYQQGRADEREIWIDIIDKAMPTFREKLEKKLEEQNNE